jgi:hypothetical protein
MHLDWRASGVYAETGGMAALRDALGESLARIPREHLRLLDAIEVWDEDPKGKALGVWRQHNGATSVEIYLRPHMLEALSAPIGTRGFVLRLYLAHTLFHEIGHHVTRVLNRRTTPPRKSDRVDATIEKWAEEYAEKRLQKLIAAWLSPGGAAETPDEKASLEEALRFLRLQRLAAAV